MWIVVAGKVSLGLMVAFAAASAFGLLYGESRGRQDLVRLGKRSFAVAATLAGVAVGLLELALITSNFHVRYVAEHSSLQTPMIYRIGALWGGASGSLLLWVFVLSMYGAYLLWRPPVEGKRLMPYAIGVMATALTGFGLLVALIDSPFIALIPAPADGLGLNRLLRMVSMLVHPLALYLGFVGFTVPFAFGLAGLLKGESGDAWIRVTHRWALTAWAMLSVGILLGMDWSYHVLGWGGYWSFDPVEIAALLPWLTATAFIHSAMVQERRGMLKVWNAVLVCGTYLLTLFGTFLTRSGLVDSVHTFSTSPIGGWLLAYLGLAVAVSVYLIGSRLDLLRDERDFESFVSKEGSFLLNNVVFLALVLTLLIGVVAPMLSGLVGPQISVGEPYFIHVTAPLFTVIILLAGIGPLLAWRRAGMAAFVEHLAVPLSAAVIFAIVLSLLVRNLPADIGFSVAFFAAASVLFDFLIALRVRLGMEQTGIVEAARRLVAANPRRYGGYTVHVAMAVIACGIVASHAFQQQTEVQLQVGQSVNLAGYTFAYEGLGTVPQASSVDNFARLAVLQNGDLRTTLLPAVTIGSDAATSAGQTTVVAISQGLTRDLYAVLDGYAPGGTTAVFSLYVNPLVSWIWFGGLLLVLGAAYSLWPRPAMLAAPRSHRVFGLWAELEYDYRMGKLGPSDYNLLRARYMAEATLALASERRGGDLTTIEARIAERAAALAAHAGKTGAST